MQLHRTPLVSVVLSLLFVIAFHSSQADATALTYTVAAQEDVCFYIWADVPEKKVGFYFAVQSGGAFDIDFSVRDPRDQIILDGQRERQGDYVFNANHVGEYTFCFSNDMSTIAEKLVDFEITLEHEVRPNFQNGGSTVEPPKSLNAMEESLFKLSGFLNELSRAQKYLRTRDNRNSSTMTSTESRIFWFSILESAVIVIMAGLQVFIVKNFFNVKKGGV
ncbi:hypothetical protein EC973_003316 [Apophysomyces ossiformis]|uniref:GOLD domain-containing protein n=1 Tax=Apophysomyces ossiformis TaxID=679940 RepID=A0A8H7EVJ2_9FUNG|nr:hypothetical protein EC973_003316 [Apophysomyces ossiformis]